MAIRSPTNTLIVTNVDKSTLESPQALASFLASDHQVMELVALPKFQRILVICETVDLSTHVLHSLKLSDDWHHLKITYSIKNNAMSIPQYDDIESHVDYLELPLEVGSKRFLISPPLSPPAEWDHWDKVEEGPNSKAVYSPQDLSHLLWERLGGFESDQVRKYETEETKQLKPEVLFEDIDNGVPAIVLDTVNNRGTAPKQMPKTAMPPVD